MASDEKMVITEEVLEVKGRGLMNVTALLKTQKTLSNNLRVESHHHHHFLLSPV
jgi:hypothetical protein